MTNKLGTQAKTIRKNNVRGTKLKNIVFKVKF